MKTLFNTLVFLFLCSLTAAQVSATAESVDLQLERLEGTSQTYFYSPQHHSRAEAIAAFLENAARFFQQELGFTPHTELYILAPEDWQQVAAPPLKEVYGFPHNIDEVRLAVAAEDNDFWRSFLPAVAGLAPELAGRVRQAYGKADGSFSMMPFFDLLALHELGHSYSSQAGLKMQRHWMGELFVNLMLHTYIAEERPELLPALEVFPGMVVAAGTDEFEFTGLADFERLYSSMGMGPKNYGWYQSKLHLAAGDIYRAAGKEALTRLWAALKAHQEEMTDEELAAMLEREVHPSVAEVLLQWEGE